MSSDNQLPKTQDCYEGDGDHVTLTTSPPATCIEDLPNELLEKLFDRIASLDLVRCTRVNRRWQGVITNDRKYLLSNPKVSTLILKQLENASYADVPYRQEGTPEAQNYFRCLLDARLVCSAWAKAIPFLAKSDPFFFDLDMDCARYTKIRSVVPTDLDATAILEKFDTMSEDAKRLRFATFAASFLPYMNELWNIAAPTQVPMEEWGIFKVVKRVLKYSKSAIVYTQGKWSKADLVSILQEADEQNLRELWVAAHFKDDESPVNGASQPSPTIPELPALRKLAFGLLRQNYEFGPVLTPGESILFQFLESVPHLWSLDIDSRGRFPLTLHQLPLPNLKELQATIRTSDCASSLLKWECPLEKLGLLIWNPNRDTDLPIQHGQLTAILEHFSLSLKHLELHSYRRLSQMEIVFPAGNNGTLEDLQSLELSGFTGRLMDFLPLMPNLRKLNVNLEELELPAAGEPPLTLDRLVELSVRFRSTGKLEGMRTALRLPSLQNLEISEEDRGQAGLEPRVTPEEFYGFIWTFSGTLRKLNLRFYWLADMKTPNSAFLWPDALTRLQTLIMSDYKGSLEFLGRLPALRHLELYEYENQAIEGFQPRPRPAELAEMLREWLPHLSKIRTI